MLRTGTQNETRHTAQGNLTDMLFLFLSKNETEGQEKAYLLSSRKRIKQTREQQQKKDAQRSHWEVKVIKQEQN